MCLLPSTTASILSVLVRVHDIFVGLFSCHHRFDADQDSSGCQKKKKISVDIYFTLCIWQPKRSLCLFIALSCTRRTQLLRTSSPLGNIQASVRLQYTSIIGLLHHFNAEKEECCPNAVRSSRTYTTTFNSHFSAKQLPKYRAYVPKLIIVRTRICSVQLCQYSSEMGVGEGERVGERRRTNH